MRTLALTVIATMLAVAFPATAEPVVTAGYDIQLHATGVGAVAGIQIGPDGLVYAVDNAGGV